MDDKIFVTEMTNTFFFYFFILVIIILILAVMGTGIAFFYKKKNSEQETTFWAFLKGTFLSEDFFNRFYSGLFSLAFTATILLYLFFIQIAEKDQKRLAELSRTLLIELKHNEKMINAADAPIQIDIEGHPIQLSVGLTYITPLILEESVKSGLFDRAFGATIVEQMLNLLLDINIYNASVNHLLSVRSTKSNGIINILTETISSKHKQIKKNIKSLETILNGLN